MPGAPDPVYVLARKVLLDALEALEPHLDALVLVGAQAVYHHTGDADLAIAEYTTDADLSIAPALLLDEPSIADALTGAGFTADTDPGRWISSEGVPLDLLVPEAEAGPGGRSADLGVHGRRIARRARGLEGSLIDRQLATVRSLDPADRRVIPLQVAGPGALLVAKLVKIGERLGQPGRERDKDALDIIRLLRAVPTAVFAEALGPLLSSTSAAETTVEAIAILRDQFTDADAEGVHMAIRATHRLEDPDTLAMSAIALAQELLEAVGQAAG